MQMSYLIEFNSINEIFESSCSCVERFPKGHHIVAHVDFNGIVNFKINSVWLSSYVLSISNFSSASKKSKKLAWDFFQAFDFTFKIFACCFFCNSDSKQFVAKLLRQLNIELDFIIWTEVIVRLIATDAICEFLVLIYYFRSIFMFNPMVRFCLDMQFIHC